MKLRPSEIPQPGAHLRDEINQLGLSQKEFAELIERPPQFLSELIHGKRELTIDTAHRLSAALGTEPAFWLKLEANYRIWLNNKAAVNAPIYRRIRETARTVSERRKNYF